MALEVEYMMEYQCPDLLVTEDCWLQMIDGYRENLLIPQLWAGKKAVVSYKPTPAEM